MEKYIDLAVTPKIKMTTLPEADNAAEAFIGGTKYLFRHVKQEEEVVDFRRYLFMEPEGSRSLRFTHVVSAHPEGCFTWQTTLSL